jgi:hypothetical protein
MRTGTTLLLAVLTPLSAQMTDQMLLDNGNRAMSELNYVDGLAYFFAYAQRYPPGMQLDPNHATQVNEVVKTARDKLFATVQSEKNLRDEVNRLRAGGLGTGSYGLSTPPPHVDNPSPQGPQTYSMICQGGGGLTFALQPSGHGMTGSMFVIGFRAAAGAGQAALQPGECTWLDRTLQSNEPKAICHPVSAANLSMQWTSDGQISSLNSSVAPYLSDLVRPGSYFTFSVFNNGRGCMVAKNIKNVPHGVFRQKLQRMRPIPQN